MKVSSLLLAGPLAMATILASGPTAALAADTAASQRNAGPLPMQGVSRTAAEKNAQISRPKVALQRSTAPFVPRSYIVELDASSASKSNAGSKRAAAVDHFHEHLVARGKKDKYTTRYEWNDPQLFVGMSVTLDSDDDLHVLLSAPNVKSIRRNTLYSLPAFDPVPASDDFVRTSVGSQPAANAKRSPASKGEAGVKDTFSPHVMTGVDKLHAAGYFGAGQTVGVIDSGIDYTHPALGGKPGNQACFGPGCKVIGGHDFVGDKYNGSNTPVADNDPFADCPGSGHGTHVAGTIAANDTTLGFTGVAPHANLRAYRVFGCGGSASDDVIISALQRAYFDGNDILSLSIGGPGGWLNSGGAAVASRIVDLGTPVVIAQGNDGAYGTYYSSAPASGGGVAAIGSVQNVQLTGYTAKVSPTGLGKDAITYLVGSPFTFASGAKPQLEVYATSTDPEIKDDGCAPLPDSTPDLSNKVVVVGRGTCPFATKFTNVAAKGAKYVFIYNTPAPASVTYVSSQVPGQQAASLTREDGQFLVKQFAAGKKVTLDFSDLQSNTEPDTASGGLMSSFSTYGLSNENRLLPQISAPGGNILSTWPIKLGKYTIISGTSMATPFMSGSFAVYRAAHGGKTSPQSLLSIFGSTGAPLRQSKADSSEYETLVKQGGGLTQSFDAFYQDIEYSPRAIELNDTTHFVGSHQITLKNTGKKPRTFSLTHQAVGTAISKKDGTDVFFNDGPVPLTSQYAKVDISKKKVTVSPGGSTTFSVKVTPPSGLDATKLPIYSGYVVLTPAGSDYTGLRIPYGGVVGDLSSTKILDDSAELFGVQLPFIGDSNTDPITDDSHVFDLSSTDASKNPKLYLRFVFGTPSYQIDVVPANTTFKPTIAINDSGSKQRRKRAIDLALAGGHKGFNVVRRQHAQVESIEAAADRKQIAEEQSQTADAAAAAPASDANAKKGGKPGKPEKPGKPTTPVPVTPPTKAGDNFADVGIVGTLYREQWIGRNSDTGLADDYSFVAVPLTRDLALPQGGSVTLPDGEYRLLLRAQKVFTQGTKEADYESYLSHKFTVKSAAPAASTSSSAAPSPTPN
ncbi:uncharacterized protein PFL1_01212 [Pseudozyma flocculosa PF-1]|uniref:Related to subtilisin-like serine protease n=1 Tax=Pseudozyma flocculosa TaxID=84751 RepID=A0A5C3EU30_9BASI|nr:uncharacterized protein PFL1_01212 [Pseudozyma flocculosa PF-1]EPQ31023.1 hypothetical protein PFL1_01212 [Pseudozyma flocculosa PF-1]SPO35863.1 related to subtilisin-like serine protease [Pseudozyma flocculosa]